MCVNINKWLHVAQGAACPLGPLLHWCREQAAQVQESIRTSKGLKRNKQLSKAFAISVMCVLVFRCWCWRWTCWMRRCS